MAERTEATSLRGAVVSNFRQPDTRWSCIEPERATFTGIDHRRVNPAYVLINGCTRGSANHSAQHLPRNQYFSATNFLPFSDA
jgi:hypothetical protein